MESAKKKKKNLHIRSIVYGASDRPVFSKINSEQ